MQNNRKEFACSLRPKYVGNILNKRRCKKIRQKKNEVGMLVNSGYTNFEAYMTYLSRHTSLHSILEPGTISFSIRIQCATRIPRKLSSEQ